jgi:hypothetical protein
MIKPVDVSNLNHCAKHGYRYKNLAWQTTADISKYITTIEAENDQIKEVLKLCLGWIKAHGSTETKKTVSIALGVSL